MSAPQRAARQPWVLGPGRRLATRAPLEHLDDLVRIVLTTGPNERLHRPGFGAGLGAAALFQPTSPGLADAVAARARGSLEDALGNRIEVVQVEVTVVESTVSAQVAYRPRPAGERRELTIALPGAGL